MLIALFFASSLIPESKNPFPIHFSSQKNFKLILIFLFVSCALHEATALAQTYVHTNEPLCNGISGLMIWWHSQAFLLTLHIAVLKCSAYAVIVTKKMLKFMFLQVKLITYSGWVVFPILLGFGVGGNLMPANDGSGISLCLHYMDQWCVILIWVCLCSLTMMVFVLFLVPVIQLMSNVDGRDYLVVRNFVGVMITIAGMAAVSVQNTLYGKSTDVNLRVKLAVSCSIDMLANSFGLAFVFVMGFHWKRTGDDQTKGGSTTGKDATEHTV